MYFCRFQFRNNMLAGIPRVILEDTVKVSLFLERSYFACLTTFGFETLTSDLFSSIKCSIFDTRNIVWAYVYVLYIYKVKFSLCLLSKILSTAKQVGEKNDEVKTEATFFLERKK